MVTRIGDRPSATPMTGATPMAGATPTTGATPMTGATPPPEPARTGAQRVSEAAPAAAPSPRLISTPKPALDGQAPALSAPAALVGRAGAPQNELPPKFRLREAMVDPAFTPLDPAKIAVPEGVLDAIKSARSVLCVGHISPDGDCVGSCLAMQRALRSMGKQVDVCVDDELSSNLRRVDTGKDVRRAADLKEGSWDLVLILDVGVPDRIGGALDLLGKAKRVAVVDHHVVEPKPEHFGLAAGTPFDVWVEEDFPATALQVGAILGKLRDDLPPALDAKSTYHAALAGFLTDTGFGTYAGISTEYYRYMKHMLIESAKSTMAELVAAVDAPLPPRMAGLANGTLTAAQVASGAPKPLADQLIALEQEGPILGAETLAGPSGEPALGILTCSEPALDAMVGVARLDDPDANRLDVTGAIKRRLSDLRKDVPLAAAIMEEGGKIFVSFRSNDAAALDLAQHMGGGGHERSSGTKIEGKSLHEVRQAILTWAAAQGRIQPSGI